MNIVIDLEKIFTFHYSNNSVKCKITSWSAQFSAQTDHKNIYTLGMKYCLLQLQTRWRCKILRLYL